MSPLYNPYVEPTIPTPPSTPEPAPAPAPSGGGGKRKKKDLTLKQMLEHSNPRIRKAAKKAVEIQTAVNTVNTALTSGKNLSVFLKQNPHIADVLSNAGVNLAASAQTQQPRFSDKFWEKNAFKEITSAANSINPEQLKSSLTRGVQATLRPQLSSSDMGIRAALPTAIAQFRYQQTQEALERQLPATSPDLRTGATAAFLGSPGRTTPSTLIQAKTAFVPQVDTKGLIKTDEYGNVVYEPYKFDEPDVPFKESLQWKEFKAVIEQQNLPWWKEKFQLATFSFFQGGVKPASEALNNLFAWQKELITQEDNPTVIGTALNLAYNTISFIGAKAREMFYFVFTDRVWETEIVKTQARLQQLKAQGLTDDDRIVKDLQTKLVSYQNHVYNAETIKQYVEQSQAGMRRAWDNLKTSASEDIPLVGSPEYNLYIQKKIAEQQEAGQKAAAPRNRAYDLVLKANSLVNVDPEKSLKLYDEAIQAITEAQKWDSLSDPIDPTWSFSWAQEPEREKLFRESMASLELQKGAPLTTNEIRRLKMYYENTWREFWGEAVFDITNLIPAKGFEAILSPLTKKFWNESALMITKGFRGVETGLTKAGKVKAAKNIDDLLKWSEKAKVKVLDNIPVISYLRRQAVATVASKRQNSVYYLFSKISGSYDTTENFLASMEQVAKLANDLRYASDEATARALFAEAQKQIVGIQSVTFDEFKRFFDVLDVDQGGIEFTKWRALYEDAMQESEPEIRRMTEQALRATGAFTDEAALSAEVTRQVKSALESPLSNGWTLGNFSEKFAGAYTDAHRLYKGSALFDDSISGQMALFFRKLADDPTEDSLVRKIFKEVTDKWESGAKLTLHEKIDHAIAAAAAGKNIAAKRRALLIADTIEGSVKLGKFFVDIWAMFVLSLNPRWIVQNYIDSSVRAWIAGSNPIDSAATMVLSMHRQLVDELGFLPIELGQSLARDGLNFSTSVTGRLVYGNWKPLPGPFGIISYFQYEVDRLKALRGISIEEASVEASKALSQRFPEGSMLRKVTNLLGGVNFYKEALSGAAQDFNTAIEFTLRLRTFHGEYFKNIKKLEQVLGGNVGLDTLSPALRGIAKQIWESSESHPSKMTALVESILRGDTKLRPAAWSTVLPPNLNITMSALTDAERNLVISSIRDKLDVLVTDIYKAGRTPLPEDFVHFFDDLEEDFKNTVNLQLSNAQRTKTISGQIGTQSTQMPDAQDMSIASSAVDREKITAAIERIGRTRGRFNPTKTFDDFKIAMSDLAPIELVPGMERHVLVSPDGKIRVTIGQDLITGKKRSELNELMHEVAIKTFVTHEADFAINAGFKSADDFEAAFRIFIGDEGPAKVLSKSPEQFITLVDEFESNPTLHHVLERTKGRPISYEATWKVYMNNLPLDKLRGKAWFDMVEARADRIHIPPSHTRHAAIRQAKQTIELQQLINSKKLGDELEQELRNFLGMYDQARKDLGQFYLWTEPGPKQFSGDMRARKWDEFYWRQAEAYGYGETLKASLVKMINDNPEEALKFLKEYNSDFYVKFLNSHGITEFSTIERAPKGIAPLQGEGAFAVHPTFDDHRAPITQFKMTRGDKTFTVQSEWIRKDLYERFLSPEKKASILTTERWDLSDIAEEIPLKDQLFNAVHDSFKLTNEQSRMYSRIIMDHVDAMVAETGEDAEYFLRRMGFLRVEGHLRAPDALRQVKTILDNEGRHLLYGFGAQNSTDLIRQTSLMFYDDLQMLARKSENAADDLLRLGDYLERVTGKKLSQGRLLDEHVEVFADVFQKYVLYGDAPNSKLKKPFERYAKWMSSVAGNALDTTTMFDIPEDVISILDRLFTASQNQTPEAANRTMRILAKNAGVEFKNKNDLLNIINEAVAPIKKTDKATLKQSIMATQSMTDEQADTIVTLLEYRARAWGALNNRPPSEYIQRLNIVTTREQMETALGKMTTNPKFQAWFGNSAVLDDAGRPKVMYHGTTRGGYSVFDKQFAKEDGNLWGPGFYFTENSEIASEYATQNRNYIDLFIDFGSKRKFLTEDETSSLMKIIDEDLAVLDAKIKPMENLTDQQILDDPRITLEQMTARRERDYLQSNKEIFAKHIEDGKLDTATLQTWANDTLNQTEQWADRLARANITGGLASDTPTVMPVYLSIQNPFDLDRVYTREEARQLMEKIDPYVANWINHSSGADRLNGEDLYDLLTEVSGMGPRTKTETNRLFQAAGYDGFTHIGGGRFLAGDTRKHRVFVALESEQIKSVYNSGEFSLDNADILKQFEGLPTTADRRRPAYEQLRNMWDKLDDADRDEVFKWLTERTLTDPLSGIETPIAKALNEKPEGWIEATSDLNALTAINNTWGHDAGDTLISGIGKIAKEEVDAVGGRAFRKGGDEFSYWFPDRESAEKALKAIDLRVQETVFTVGGKRRKGFTVSYGIGDDFDAADKALYVDKERRVALGQRPLVRDTIPSSVMALAKQRADNLHSELGLFGAKDDKKVIAIFNGADFSVLPHELGHMFRTELPETDLRIIEKATGIGEGDFDFLKSRFGEYNKALEGKLSPDALKMSRSEYDVYFNKLQADANKYEKAEEMFADGFVRYLRIGKSPIPELQTIFEKFKQWLAEIWRAVKRNSDLSLQMTPEIRGVYDRLFQIPPGEYVPPVRYNSLADVPHDVANGIFRTRASEQVFENIDAAFNVWKLRYDLQGLPLPAMKNFHTAKAYVKQQFNETTGDLANQYRILMWRFEQFEDAMLDNMMKAGFIDRVDKTVDDFFAPMLDEIHMDDGVKTFMRNGIHNRKIYDQLQAGLYEWRNFLSQAAGNGTPFPVLTREEAAELRQWSVGAAERKAKIMDLSVNGGKYEGVSIEGALPKTNRFMLDYQDRNNFDQIMKNFFPFWMFPSRSLPFWAKTLATHPQIVLLYQKMKKMSEAERYQAGAVTSKGIPLPSLENHIPIPGMGMWINPAAPLSFRYLLDIQSYGNDMFYKAQAADDGDESAYQFISKQFMELSPIFGFSPGPWVTFAMRQSGIPTPQWSLIPQTNLIPPWYIPEFINRTERMLGFGVESFDFAKWHAQHPSGNDTWAPEPPWHDFLVERDMLEEAAQYVSNPKLTDLEKKTYMGKITQAISEKGENPVWAEAYKAYVQDEKKKNIFAFLTGFYPKEFSDQAADLLQARNEYILQASAMNNSFQASMLQIPMNEQIRWNNYRAQYRVDTPLGWLYHLYGDIGWVTDESHRLVNNPEERAKLIADRIQEDNNARAYFAGASKLERWKNQNLAALPIGANYDQTQAVLDKYYAQLHVLEDALMPPYKYFGTNKPVTLIENDIRNLWWKRIYASRPGWVEGMDYDEYDKRILEWEKNIPNIAKTFAVRFRRDPKVQQYMRYLDTDQPIDLNKLMTLLISESTVHSFNLWRLENDDIFTAMNTVWQENYWDVYWDKVSPLKNEERDLAEMDFFKDNPTPKLDQIYKWVVEKYGPDRFTFDEVRRWVLYDPDKTTQIYNIDQRHLQDVGETAITREHIWSVLSWAGPGKQRDILENAFVDIGGNPDDLERWYSAPHGLAWEDDPAHVQDFYNKLSQAARTVQLRAPNRMQLEQFMAARKENDLLNEILVEKLGEKYQEAINIYFFKSDNLDKQPFRIWKSQNREIVKLVDDYFYTRKVFGMTHKLWAAYYQWKPKPNVSNIGQSGMTPIKSEFLSPPVATEADESVVSNQRTQQALQQELAISKPPLTFSFGPQWPTDMKKRISPSLVQEIESVYRGYGKLSSSARTYLNAVYKNHPEWRPFIEKILSL